MFKHHLTRRALSLVLTLAVALSLLAAVPLTANAADVKVSIADLQQRFPAGKYWTHTGANNPNSVTGYPAGNSGYVGNAYTVNGVAMSWQCMGFAEQLGFLNTGTNPRSAWTVSKNVGDVDNIKIGDIVRYYWTGSSNHSAFVIGVSGDTITLAEANIDGYNKIGWGRVISKTALKQPLSRTTYARLVAAGQTQVQPYVFYSLQKNPIAAQSLSVGGANTAVGSMSASPAKSVFTTNEDVVINWTKASGATEGYGLTVRVNNSARDKVWEGDRLTGNSKNIGSLPAGEYRFAMQGYSNYAKDIHGPVSATAYFSVTAAVSAPGNMASTSKAEYSAGSDIVLAWTTSSGADWYGITVRNAGTGTAIVDGDYYNGNSLNLGKLAAGNYSFAIRGHNSAGWGNIARATFTVKSAPVQVSPAVSSVSPNKSSVNSGNSVTVYVKTNSVVNSVELINESGEHVAGAYSPYNILSNGDKEWSVPWQTSKTGGRTINARAHIGNSFDGAYAERSFSITVTEVARTMEIISIAVANPTLRVSEYCWMTVVTSPDITGIWITNESGGNTVYELVRSYPVGSNKGWDIGWQLGKSGYRMGYVIATNGSQTTSRAFNCTAYD